MTLRLSWLAGCVALVSLAPIDARAASFDCTKARSRVEVLICGDTELSALDDETSALYARAKRLAPDRDALIRDGRDAWHRREATCTDKACLVAWYAERKLALSQQPGSESAPVAKPPPSGPQSEPPTQESPAQSMERVRAAVIVRAQLRGQTEAEYYASIGTTPINLAAFAITAEKYGSPIASTLKSFEGLTKSLDDPDKRTLMRCIGVEIYRPPVPPLPSAEQCKQAQQRACPDCWR